MAEKLLVEKVEFEMPDIGEETYQILGDCILFVRVECDEFQPNPLEDWDGTGKIYSFSPRHVNYVDPRGDVFGHNCCPKCGFDEPEWEWWGEENELEDSVIYCPDCEHTTPQSQQGDWYEKCPDIVALGYFEHGNYIWHVAGEIPLGTEGDYHWDGTRLAGYWEPDEALTKEVEGLEPKERRKKMEEFARQACDVYTDWCNGWVYGYIIEAYTHKPPYDEMRDYHDAPEFEDSRWGFYGWDHLKEEVETVWGLAVKALTLGEEA